MRSLQCFLLKLSSKTRPCAKDILPQYTWCIVTENPICEEASSQSTPEKLQCTETNYTTDKTNQLPLTSFTFFYVNLNKTFTCCL